MNDHELLQDYVQNGSQAAFAGLVERHVGLVHSAARRLVRDAHLAEDVTQEVFMLLARKAHRMGSDTILSAWLYRATRHVASETTRREGRRRHREQLAVETMSQSTADAEWQQIEPLLDEAMANLSTADHDAIVLRYFESRSLRDVGAALGSSEDAAQKRVARALERLRMNLTRRGVTVSATALAAAVSSGAVQSAPAGLAVSAASVSFVAATGTNSIVSILKVMATTNIKFISAAVVIAGLSISLFVLGHQNASLRRELAILRTTATGASHPAATNSDAAQATLSRDELRRLRKEHLELLSLRGRFTQLANELRLRNAAGTQASGKPNPTLEEKEADSILFTAALTNRVASGNTLVVGGWSKEGMRAYFLFTPVIKEGDGTPGGRQVTVQSQGVGAPESFWDEIGWGSFKSDTRRSTLACMLTPEQLGSLIQALEEAKDAGISNISSPTGPDGKRMGFAWSRKEDNESQSGVLMNIDLYPRIAPDGQSVDLELLPNNEPLTVPIHGSLRPTGAPTSSPAP
ncbi:MAG: RNA polymerase sigma factor [Limisphaerales bacterium]